MNIIANDAIMRMRDRIRKVQSGWKREELSTRNMGKSLNKVFKVVLKEIKNSFFL